MKKSQIFTRTFICAVSIMIILLVLLHVSIYILLPQFYLSNTKQELTRKADILSRTLNGFDELDIESYLQIYAKNDNIDISLQTDQGSPNSIYIKNDLGIDKTNIDNSVFIEMRSITLKNGKEATLVFISSRNARRDAERLTLNFLPYSLVIGLVFSILFSYLSSKIIVKPILIAEKISSDVERNKNTFLRSTSHELKTPLAGLRVTLENMRYNVGDYKNHSKYLDFSISLVDKMSTIISEILNVSAYQEWLKKPLSIQIKKELPKIIREYQPLISAKNLVVNVCLGDEKINISKSAFQKLFSNLVSNAVKYSNHCGVINIFIKNQWFYIENTCTPIKKQDIPALFNIFYHGEHTESTGIGLFVVKNILEYYNIKYRLKPTESGMVFCFRLR